MMEDIGDLTSDEFPTAARWFLMQNKSRKANGGNPLS